MYPQKGMGEIRGIWGIVICLQEQLRKAWGIAPQAWLQCILLCGGKPTSLSPASAWGPHGAAGHITVSRGGKFSSGFTQLEPVMGMGTESSREQGKAGFKQQHFGERSHILKEGAHTPVVKLHKRL